LLFPRQVFFDYQEKMTIFFRFLHQILRKMKKKNKILLTALVPVILLLVFSFVQVDPGNNIIKNILFRLETYYDWYPQQKVYLHTDKNSYDASETIWIKGYLVNASDHKHDSSSTNLYLELVDPNGNIVQEKLLKLTRGFANGDFSFTDTIPEGLYRIRAYTNWMLNTGEDFLFTKDVYLANPEFRVYATKEKVRIVKRESKSNVKKAEKFDVSFYPEGGHLVAGAMNRIGFKALNHLGAGVNVTGALVDKKGRRVAEFSSAHAGMGSFSFKPETGP
jgi:hypothetical protein